MFIKTIGTIKKNRSFAYFAGATLLLGIIAPFFYYSVINPCTFFKKKCEVIVSHAGDSPDCKKALEYVYAYQYGNDKKVACVKYGDMEQINTRQGMCFTLDDTRFVLKLNPEKNYYALYKEFAMHSKKQMCDASHFESRKDCGRNHSLFLAYENVVGVFLADDAGNPKQLVGVIGLNRYRIRNEEKKHLKEELFWIRRGDEILNKQGDPIKGFMRPATLFIIHYFIKQKKFCSGSEDKEEEKVIVRMGIVRNNNPSIRLAKGVGMKFVYYKEPYEVYKGGFKVDGYKRGELEGSG